MESIKVGDEIVYAFAGRKAVGTVKEVNGHQAKVHWHTPDGMNLCPNAFYLEATRKLSKLEKALK